MNQLEAQKEKSDRDREPSNEYNGFTYMAESVTKELNNLAKNDDPE